MKKQTASLAFLGVCLVLAVMLLANVISPLLSGIFFAIALAAFGILSRGFNRK